MSRALFSHSIWLQQGPFSPGQAWVDLIGLAAWKDTSFSKRGNQIYLRRGQIGMSIKGLADRWQWSQGKVKRFLKWLKNEDQIEEQNSAVTTVITITNYDDYQKTERKTESRRRADGEQTETIEESKELKEVKEEKSVISADEFFERWNRFAAKTPKISPIRKMTGARKDKLRQRLSDPEWLPMFRIAVASLPLGGDGWQPTLDWLLNNESNVYRLAEGAFDFRNENSSANKLALKRRQAAELANVERDKQEREEMARQTREALQGQTVRFKEA